MLRPWQYEFGEYRLDPTERVLFRQFELIPLTPKALDTLLFLVERRGHIIEKDDLMKAIWPDTFVEEVSLARNISVIRKVLSDGEDGRVFIETIPKRGYRFVAPVKEVVPEKREVAPEEQPAAPAQPRKQTSALRIASIISVLLALMIGTAYLLWHQISAGRALVSQRIMLVVLPVQNLTGDPTRDYVSDGLTEEIIAQLGALNPSSLGVIARTSSMSYQRTGKTIGQISRELNVDYVLESSLREDSGEVRFTAQLIRASDQTHIWAHSYERPMNDVISLQGELARAIADEIRIELTPQVAAKLSKSRAVDPGAYDAYVQGRYHWNERSAEEVRSAIADFNRAIARDPDFAPAYGSLADSYTLLTMMRDAPPGEMMPKAKDTLLKALALDDSLADAHTVLGEVTEVFDWDWAAAEKEFWRAIELDPNNANAHHQFAIHLAVMGRFPQALEEMRAAQTLDPVSPVMFTSTGWIYIRGRAPDRAIPECLKAIDLDSKFARGHLCLGEAYEEQHDLNKAAEEFLAARVLTGMPPEALEELRNAIRKDGYAAYVRIRLKELEEKSKNSYVSPYDLADFSMRCGDREGALKWLDAAFKERSPYLVFLHIEPRIDPLRSDPKYQDILHRIGSAGFSITPIPARN